MPKVNKLILIVCAPILMGAFVLFAVSHGVLAGGDVVAQGKFNGWQYITRQESDGSLVSQITYDHTSPADLQRYIQENQRLANQLRQANIGKAHLVITFNRPVSVPEFRSLVQAQGLQAQGYTLRLVQANGKRVTVGGAPTENELISEDHLKSILNVLAQNGVTDPPGVISVEGDVDITAYNQIAGDANVFLADVSGAFVRYEVQQHETLRSKPHRTIVQPAFWYLEDWGLTK